MRSLVKIHAIVALSAAAASCGADTRGPNDKDIADSAKNIVKEHRLMGTWQSGCNNSGITGLVKQRDSIRYLGNGFTKSVDYFVNDNCDEPSVTIKYEGKVLVKDNNELGGNANNLNYDYEKVIVTPRTEGGVTSLRVSCNGPTWVLNVEQDLTNRSADWTCIIVHKVPQKRFDVSLIDGDELFLGTREGADAETNRPTAVNRDKPFTGAHG